MKTSSAEDNERISGKGPRRVSKETCAALLSIFCEPPIMSGISSIRRTEPNNPVTQDKTTASIVFTVEDFYLKIASKETLPTDPALEASWMGSFRLKDEQTIIRFKAHPTRQCGRKVFEFSNKMPQVLEFELLPYQHFLTDFFEGYNPDEKDIGLYFFPHDIERSNTYNSLLEHLSEQSYMRSCINGVELLVFTSKVLQEDSRKLSNYDFLWGVYRPVKHRVIDNMVVDSTNAQESNTIPECTEEVKMEVDMIAGEDVGTRDVVIHKQSSSREEGNDVPPGFDLLLSSSGGKRKRDDDIPPGFSEKFKKYGGKK